MQRSGKIAAILLALLLFVSLAGCKREVPVTDIPESPITAAPSVPESAAPSEPAASTAPNTPESSTESAPSAGTAGVPSSDGSTGSSTGSGASSSASPVNPSPNAVLPSPTPGSTASQGTSGSGSISGGNTSGGGSSSGSDSAGTPPLTEDGYPINFEYITNGDGTAKYVDYRKNIAFDVVSDLSVITDGIGETAILLTDEGSGYVIGDNVTDSFEGEGGAFLSAYLQDNLSDYFDRLYGGMSAKDLSVSTGGDALASMEGTVTANGKTVALRAELIRTEDGGIIFKAVLAPEGSDSDLEALQNGIKDIRPTF